jgi:micrococcal nuclease
MKKFLLALAVFLLIGAGCETSQQIQPSIKQEVQHPTQPAVNIEIPPIYESSAASSEESIKAEEGTVLVTRVIDGDTIEIEGGQHVRYIGINTPETVDPRKPVECYGVEASNRNKQLVEGKLVRLEKDVSETDQYGRLLRYVYVDNVFVNLILVQEGFAYSSAYPPDVKYQGEFTDAERMARENNKGLWGGCPAGSTETPTESESVTTSQSPSNNCVIKGNISSSKEKIYHLPGCASYNQTVIDTSKGERWFCTEAEALAAGWRKAKNCP